MKIAVLGLYYTKELKSQKSKLCQMMKSAIQLIREMLAGELIVEK